MKQRLLTLVAVVSTVGVVCGAGPSVKEQEPLDKIQNRPEKTELLTSAVEVHLDLRTEQPMVSVMINGKGPFRLLLDTAASSTVLDDDVVKAAGLKVSGKTKPTDASIAYLGSVDVVRIDSLALGDAVFRSFDAIAVDLDKVFGGKRHRDGTLALPVFSSCLMTLDYPEARVVMQEGELPAADGESVLDYKEADGAAAISLAFGDVSVEATIDSAVPAACVLASSVRVRIELGYEPWAPEYRGGVITDMEPRTSTVEGTVRLGRHGFVALPVDFQKGGSVIGQKMLRNFAVTLDQKNHRVRFARKGDDLIRLSPPPRLGIELKRRGSYLKVVNVHPDSPVADSVIDTGNKITGFEGRPVSDYTDEAITSILRTADVVVFTVDRSGFPLLVPVRAREN